MRKFRSHQCPICRYNNDDFACTRVTRGAYSGEIPETKHAGWTTFKGRTRKNCPDFKKKLFADKVSEGNQE